MHDLSGLQLPAGGFAMVAIDQRESLREMLGERREAPVADRDLVDFKVAATRLLSPHASAVLVDTDFALDAVVASDALSPGCGLIVAADEFVPGVDELVGDTRIDRGLDLGRLRALGVVALKLLVLWRPDEPAGSRVAMVSEFLGICRENGFASIVEGVSRPPRSGGPWDWDDGVLAAAAEFGRLGADLYKAEVPRRGQGPEDELRQRCARITELVDSPWVVLSSGVPMELFPNAVRCACAEGAAGFLAGRAVWRDATAAAEPARRLEDAAIPRLRGLAGIVRDAVLARRPGGSVSASRPPGRDSDVSRSAS